MRRRPAFVSLCFLSMTFLYLVASTSCDGGSSGFNITSQSDAKDLEDCVTLIGDVYISADNDTSEITLNGVKEITGQLSFAGRILNTFAATDLETLGSLKAEWVAPKNLTFNALTTIGAISITGESLESLNFLSGLSSWSTDKPSDIYISQTSIESLVGIDFPIVGNLTIEGNQNLSSVSINASTTTSTDLAYILISKTRTVDSGNFSVQFPNLVTLNGISIIQYASELEMQQLQVVNARLTVEYSEGLSLSLPSLVNISGFDSYLAFYGSLSSSLDMPKLENGTNLAFEFNEADFYDNLSFPSLKTLDVLGIEDSSTYPVTVNCSRFEPFYCNSTVSTLLCLNISTFGGSQKFCDSNSAGQATVNTVFTITVSGAAMIVLALGMGIF